MEKKNQNLEQVKKAKGNLIQLTVKDVTKVKGGLAQEASNKAILRRERASKN